MVDHIPNLSHLANIANNHEQRIEALEGDALAMSEWKASIDRSIEVQQEMLEVGRDIAGALHVLGWIGTALKWLSYTGAACAVIWATIKKVGP